MTDGKKVEDGGAAFPTGSHYLYQREPIGCEPSGQRIPVYSPSTPGMSLRDWFAGQALVGLLAASGTLRAPKGSSDVLCEAMAIASYEFADAMLTARKSGAA